MAPRTGLQVLSVIKKENAHEIFICTCTKVAQKLTLCNCLPQRRNLPSFFKYVFAEDQFMCISLHINVTISKYVLLKQKFKSVKVTEIVTLDLRLSHDNPVHITVYLEFFFNKFPHSTLISLSLCGGMSFFIHSYSTKYPTKNENSHLDLKLHTQEKQICTL